MRIHLILAALAFALSAAPATADDLTLRADAPVVEVQINGKPARLLVDTLLPDVVVINPDAARRLGVQPVPMIKATVIDDDVSISGRIARPKVVFANGKQARALTGLFGRPYQAVAALDGAMGPGVLPYDRVRIILKDGPAGARARTFALRDAEVWYVRTPLNSATGVLNFDLKRTETALSRAATNLLSANGQLTPNGDVVSQGYLLGLTTKVQPVTVAATIGGFAFGPSLARTNAPLVPPDGLEVTVIAPSKEKIDYGVSLGRAALAACSELVWERRAKSLTVLCE